MPTNVNGKRRILEVVWCIMFGLTIILQLAARTIDGFAQWYGEQIYPIFVQTLGRFCSIFPFSIVEFVLYGFILYVIVRVIYCIKNSKKEEMCWRGLIRFAITVASILILLFTLNCGINYFRKPFSEESGFVIGEHNEDELRALCEYLVEEINSASRLLERDENGIAKMEMDLHEEVQNAMQNLSKKYPALGGYYPNPKPLVFSEFLTYQYIMGIYSPFTLEANYNADMLPYEIPYSICHELSHLKGFMREDEAGFIAYLACHYSGNVMLQYSGAMEAFSYAIGTYYDVAGEEAYREIFLMLDEEVVKEIQAKNLWWEEHETWIQELSSKINDVYLKANAQEDGIKGYGRMVDLLLEEFLANRDK